MAAVVVGHPEDVAGGGVVVAWVVLRLMLLTTDRKHC